MVVAVRCFEAEFGERHAEMYSTPAKSKDTIFALQADVVCSPRLLAGMDCEVWDTPCPDQGWPQLTKQAVSCYSHDEFSFILSQSSMNMRYRGEP